MTARNLALLVAALLILGAGVWLADSRNSGPVLGSELLYPQLQNELDHITTVRVLRPGASTAVTLQRQDDRWQVGERHGYAADTTRLRKLLLALADAKMFEAKTSNPEQYATLGVQDIAAPDASGVQVELEHAGQPYQLIIGNRGAARDTYFVRRAGDAQSWLVDAALEASADPAQWLHREVLNIAPERIQSVEVRSGDDRPYTAAKQSPTDEDFTVTGLPRGKTLKSPSAADGVATALSTINLTDVMHADTVTTSAARPAARSQFKTFDGLVITATGYRDGEQHLITVTTAFDAEQAERFKSAVHNQAAAADTTVNADAQAAIDSVATRPATLTETATSTASSRPTTETDASTPAAMTVAQESQQLNQHLSDWAFALPAFKYEALFKPAQELTE